MTSDVWKWVAPSKFYLLVFFYSIQSCVYHLFNLVFNANRYRRKIQTGIPPKCLTAQENGIHKYVKLNTTKYHYVEQGDHSKPLLLFLHGYPEFWYSWRFQLRHLSTKYWVVALDMKGHGDSDKPSAQSEYHVPVLVEELHDFLTAIEKRKCTIISHGIGGLVAWCFANEFPQMVENFISISSPHPIAFLQELSLGRASPKTWYYSCLMPYLPEYEAMSNDLKIFERLFDGMIRSKRGNMTKQDLEAYRYTFSRIEDWTGPINHFRTLLLRLGKYEFRKSQIPTLFIAGNVDPYFTLEMMVKSSEYVDNFVLKVVEGGGHFLNQEMPTYINSLILDFLKIPEAPVENKMNENQSILRKFFGAGKSVVNYGNQVWSTSKDAVIATTSFPTSLQIT